MEQRNDQRDGGVVGSAVSALFHKVTTFTEKIRKCPDQNMKFPGQNRKQSPMRPKNRS